MQGTLATDYDIIIVNSNLVLVKCLSLYANFLFLDVV